MDKLTVAIELANALEENTLEEYEQNKIILLAVSAGRESLTHFLQAVFNFVESRRPLLIEMKGECE